MINVICLNKIYSHYVLEMLKPVFGVTYFKIFKWGQKFNTINSNNIDIKIIKIVMYNLPGYLNQN